MGNTVEFRGSVTNFSISSSPSQSPQRPSHADASLKSPKNDPPSKSTSNRRQRDESTAVASSADDVGALVQAPKVGSRVPLSTVEAWYSEADSHDDAKHSDDQEEPRDYVPVQTTSSPRNSTSAPGSSAVESAVTSTHADGGEDSAQGESIGSQAVASFVVNQAETQGHALESEEAEPGSESQVTPSSQEEVQSNGGDAEDGSEEHLDSQPGSEDPQRDSSPVDMESNDYVPVMLPRPPRDDFKGHERRGSDIGKVLQVRSIDKLRPFDSHLEEGLLLEEEIISPPQLLKLPLVGTLANDLERTCELLSSTTGVWQRRVSAMIHVKDLAKKSSTLQEQVWWDSMSQIGTAMGVQLGDLRSSVVKMSCIVMLSIASACGSDDRFMPFLEAVMPMLLNRLAVTVKTINDACDECIKGLLRRTHSVSTLGLLAKDAVSSKHREVRLRCTEYSVRLVLRHTTEELEPHFDSLSHIASVSEKDLDGEVRRCARQLYQALAEKSPTHAQKVLEGFSPVSRQLVASDQIADPSRSPKAEAARQVQHHRLVSRNLKEQGGDSADAHASAPKPKLRPSRRHPSYVEPGSETAIRKAKAEADAKAAKARRDDAPLPDNYGQHAEAAPDVMSTETMSEDEWEQMSR